MADYFNALDRPTAAVFDVREYRARGDGTTDDTAAIQAALNAAGALAVTTPNLQSPAGSALFNGAVVVYVPPGIHVVGQLSIPNRVTLAGSGWGSILKLKSGSNTSLIVNASHAVGCVVRDIRLWGNSANQSGTSHGVLVTDSAAYNATLDEDYDSTFDMHNVLVWDCLSDGVRTVGRGSGRLVNVKAYQCRGHGFYLDQDMYLIGCDAGWSGLHGFRVYGSGGAMVGCKGWYSGIVAGSPTGNYSGAHLFFVVNYIVSGSSFQDNGGAGLFIEGCTGVAAEGVNADSNNAGNNGRPGIDIYGSSNCRISGSSVDNNRNATHQGYALKIGGSSIGNTVDLASVGNDTGHVSATAADVSGNVIRVNGQGGSQAVAYAASVTADPYLGESVHITLTGNITLANPTAGHFGQRLTYVLTQDGTGGRTTTFGNAFKSSWTPNTTAGRINTISFVYDGTAWVQTASVVGLT